MDDYAIVMLESSETTTFFPVSNSKDKKTRSAKLSNAETESSTLACEYAVG